LKETQHSSLLARNIHRIARIYHPLLRESSCTNRPLSLRESYFVRIICWMVGSSTWDFTIIIWSLYRVWEWQITHFHIVCVV